MKTYLTVAAFENDVNSGATIVDLSLGCTSTAIYVFGRTTPPEPAQEVIKVVTT